MSARDRWLLVLTFVLGIVVDLLAYAISSHLWLPAFWITFLGWLFLRQRLRRRASAPE